jgi:phosphoribosylformylglycinamidine synthase
LAKIVVSLKPVVNDPPGITIHGALGTLGFGEVESVRSGKYFEVRLQAASQEVANARVEEICRRLLANPIIEDFRFTVEPI